MNDFDSVFTKCMEHSKADMESTVAWFYLRFLPGGTDERLISTASTILFPKDYEMLPPPKGKREAAALRVDPILKKDFLKAQLRDIIEAYGGQLRLRDTQVPENIRKKLDDRLDKFINDTAGSLSGEIQKGFLRGDPAQEMAGNLVRIFEKEAGRVNSYIQACYTQAGWYRSLEGCTQAGYSYFRFAAAGSENTCGRCAAQGGKTYTLDQLVGEDLLPPLHPNCRCQIVPVSGTAEEEGTSDEWYDPLLRIPDDAWRMLLALFEAQKARLAEGNLLDWLTFGIVSGFVNGLSERADVMMEEPSFFNIGNWLTLGLFDLGKGAFAPEEPLSLEHWLNAFGFASVVYGAYTAAQQGVQIRLDLPGNDPLQQLYRKVKNTGNYQDLEELMQLKYVKQILNESGIGYDGIQIKIIREPDLIGKGLCGYTNPNGKSVVLYPDAFTNKETLIKTLGHERIHIYQIKTFGPPLDVETLIKFEKGSWSSEVAWWEYYKYVNGEK